MGADKELDAMSQEEIDALFLKAFKTPNVLDKIKNNFDRAYIEYATTFEKEDGNGDGRMLQAADLSRRPKLNNALESKALNVSGQHMMTTIFLGGPLEVNGTVYKNSSQNKAIQDKFRRDFVANIKEITDQSDYSDEKIFGAKVNFGSEFISQANFKKNVASS